MKSEKIQKIVELTKQLVAFRSETKNPTKVNEAHEFLQNYIQERKDVDVKIFEKNNVKSYYYTHKNVSGKEICLCGHIDVVPANDEQYTPTSDEKYIYGRGSGDMKAGVAVMTQIFLENSDKNISLLITGDEEVGGPDGAGYVYDKINPNLMLICEPSSNKMILTEKAATWLELEVKAPGGHASRPWQAKNAIDILIDIISDIRTKIPRRLEECWENTMNIGAFVGGDYVVEESDVKLNSANKIAQIAKCKLDFRLTEKTQIDELVQQVQELIDKKEKELGEKYSLSLKKCTHVDLMHTVSDNPYVMSFRKVLNSLGIDDSPTKEHGASDGRFFSKKGIPVILFGPKSTGYHADNEKVEINSIIKNFEVLENFIHQD